jgi:hypothetical protein
LIDLQSNHYVLLCCSVNQTRFGMSILLGSCAAQGVDARDAAAKGADAIGVVAE